MLNHVAEWCSKWCLKVNTNKSKVMHVRPKRLVRTEIDFVLGNELLNVVNDYKYLGFYFDEFMDLNKGINILSDAAGRSLGAVVSKFKSLRDAGFYTYTKLCDSCVVPIIDYFSGIWCFTKNSARNKVQNKACRFYLESHAKAPIPDFQGEIGWMLPKYRHFFSMVRLWNRYCMSSNNRITRKVLLWGFKQNINSWSHELKLICQHIRCREPIFGEVYNLTIVKNHILAKQENEWREALLSKQKLRTYITFKTIFYTEKYVQKYTCKRERSLFAQSRVGISPFKIETGRYRGIAIEERICQFCESLVEVHFLCICPLYVAEIFKLYTSIIERNELFEPMEIITKFQCLMQLNLKDVLHFVNRAWNIRKEFIYN